MGNRNFIIQEMSVKSCMDVFGGEVQLVGWKRIDGIWYAVYRDV